MSVSCSACNSSRIETQHRKDCLSLQESEDTHETQIAAEALVRTKSSSMKLDLKAMPKIELHAHFSGSISRENLHLIWAKKNAADPNYKVPDPLIEMPLEKDDWDLETFFPLFNKSFYSVINDVQSIKQCTRDVLEEFQADGVVYLELRTTPRSINAPDAKNHISPRDYVSIIHEVMIGFSLQATNTLIPRLILSINREQTLAEAESTLDIALDFRPLVVGLDLCGNPSKGDITLFSPVFKRAKTAGLGITVHFAEIPLKFAPISVVEGTNFSAMTELDTMLSWNPDRLGHAIHIPGHLKEVIRLRRIALELCLTCNIKAKMLPGDGAAYESHHFGEWYAAGSNPLILGTDDSAVFLSTLSKEYELAQKHFNISEFDLMALAREAVEATFVEEDVKKRVRALMW